jgi:hypothetical protein
VIWARNFGPKGGSTNLTPTIRRWFLVAGFRELAVRRTMGGSGIGTHQFTVRPKPYVCGVRHFSTFNQRW